MDPIERQLRERIAQLEKEVRRAERERRQLARQGQQAERAALRSRQALLAMNSELQSTIADLEQASEELRLAKVNAEAASEAKGRFVATISHELRTPMNGILGTAELMLSSELDEEQRELATIVHRSARGLLAVISDVLDFSKAESCRLELERVHFDVVRLVHTVVELQANAARNKDLELVSEIDPDAPRLVAGDPGRLRQVLLNLTDNAIKFTDAGSVRIQVQSLRTEDERVRFRVVDTGIGIEEAAIGSIFDPFTQADSSTTRCFGGTGLGLAICRHLTQLMGGPLRVESTPGEGSVFEFEYQLPDVSAEVRSLTETRFLVPPRAPTDLAVLVVDDNPVNRLIASRMLQRLGCRVETADGGEAAVARVARGGLQVVFMDCSMPGMDGFQATAAVRALPGVESSVRIVAMTAHALDGYRQRCLASGMDDYVSKPIQMDVLRRLIQDLPAPR